MHHREHVAFAEEAIQHGGIVMTHFAPSWWSIAPAYVTSEVNSYCATDLEVLITRKCPTLWVHSHILARNGYRIGETTVVCNLPDTRAPTTIHCWCMASLSAPSPPSSLLHPR